MIRLRELRLFSNVSQRHCEAVQSEALVMAALWHMAPAGHYIFALWFLSFCLFYSTPNLSGRRLDVYHTSTHGVALARI